MIYDLPILRREGGDHSGHRDEYHNELDAALRAAVKAGRAVMEIYDKVGGDASSPQTVRTKADGSPVTGADLASHRILAGELAGTGHVVRSEEGEAVRTGPNSDTIWIIDPLDGTSDFVDRTGEFTVMVALVRKGVPVLGVIVWPAAGAAFAAQRGRGAFRYADGRGWRRIKVTGSSSLSECRVIGSRHHLTDREKGLITRLGAASFASIGSSLKVCMISSGEAEAYITTTDKMKQWDTAASHCIITEAGGRMTDMLGRDLVYDDDHIYHPHGILATNGAVHDRIVREFGVYDAAAAETEEGSEQSAPAEK